VSRLLAGVSHGRPETRARVLAAVEALDYRPSAVARSLRSRSTRTLGLVITDITNPFYPELVRAVEDAAHALGYALLLGNSVADPARELAYLELLAARRVDGLIIAAGDIPERHAAWLRRTALPVVVVNGESPEGSLPSAASENRRGARAAARHLLHLGHRRLGLVTAAVGDGTTRLREAGIREAIAAAGRDPATLVVEQGARHVSGGEAAMTALLVRAPAVTGVLCHNDLMALGALRAVRAAGLRVPRDVSIVGFDDIDLAAYAEPPLTTVAQDTGRLGRWGVERLVALLQAGARGRDAGPFAPTTVPTRLVVRGSTGPPAAAR
jgi:LacI family transcriptional regulator